MAGQGGTHTFVFNALLSQHHWPWLSEKKFINQIQLGEVYNQVEGEEEGAALFDHIEILVFS